VDPALRAAVTIPGMSNAMKPRVEPGAMGHLCALNDSDGLTAGQPSSGIDAPEDWDVLE